MREISGSTGATLERRSGKHSLVAIVVLLFCVVGVLSYFFVGYGKTKELREQLSKLAAVAGDDPKDLYRMAEGLEEAGLSHERILEIYRTLFSAMQQARKELSAQEEELASSRVFLGVDRERLRALTGASKVERIFAKGLNELLARAIAESVGREKNPEFFQNLARLIGPSSHEELQKLQEIVPAMHVIEQDR